jgi:sulfur-oxidizing protein SoxZ
MAKRKIKPRVRVPQNAKSGDIIEIKTLVNHPMESGERRRKDGSKYPRYIINKFTVSYDGEEVFRANWYPAVSKNPFLTFHVVAQRSGTLEFVWVDDNGDVYTKKAEIKVAG